MRLESIIQQQQETLQGWHQQSQRDTEDLVELLIESFQVRSPVWRRRAEMRSTAYVRNRAGSSARGMSKGYAQVAIRKVIRQ
ncbi:MULTISPECIES: hypothetical protein [Acidithiobacillus]|uniref:Uncharacterized protein n=1 Tax=Acidithiobacillus thiooxidans TaxID=930 RepID=A0A1C2I6U2_ACITH|nr:MULTISPECIES: hypothetical protein [Acidithiobacillus]OCX70934.1 hypothetical protein A6P07_13080 [Acidithiobacillus thiooxidans]OCX71647.1 hypothetical protein A6M23_11375 [Acidithiobacillus thiooxidans]OCX78797.1 hypothetical protein A6O24_03435 [Acidithiobacillus thiooxidans]OCX84832.1 hypothetical protein A6O26_03350 [Acidithiobacillus thiooxidans]OCX87456.1 hypothetical protein A6P08_02390 [Acidithiobacillus thiooxidans]